MKHVDIFLGSVLSPVQMPAGLRVLPWYRRPRVLVTPPDIRKDGPTFGPVEIYHDTAQMEMTAPDCAQVSRHRTRPTRVWRGFDGPIRNRQQGAKGRLADQLIHDCVARGHPTWPVLIDNIKVHLRRHRS
jgi:hypothetical protein